MCLSIPGKLLSLSLENGLLMGKVDFDGVSKSICFELVPEAVPGDYALVHVGFALSLIDEAEAVRIFAMLGELGELKEISEAQMLSEADTAPREPCEIFG